MDSRDQLYRIHLAEKRMRMISLLERIGCEQLCQGITSSPLKGGFRNRAKFQVYENQDMLRIEGTDPFQGAVPFEKALWILPAWARRIVRSVATYRKEYRRDFPFDGFELQLTHGRQRAHAIISVKRACSEFFDVYAKNLWETIPELIGVSIPSQKIERGDVFLDHWILGKNFSAHYGSFFQSNLSLIPRLLRKIASEAHDIDYERIIDLYSGVGLLSLSIAQKGMRIIGVDSDRKSVNYASRNALRQGFELTSFIHAKIETYVKSAKFRPDSLIIINPPRAGCDVSIIPAIARQRPKNIILVSCYLETHVRDLEMWLAEGYEVASISAFDMFPFSPFLETVTRLKSNP